MRVPFSERHKELIFTAGKEKIKLSLSKKLRRKIYRALHDFGKNNFIEGFDSFKNVKRDFLIITGEEFFRAYIDDEYLPVSDMESFILGAKPQHVLDIIELMYLEIFPDRRDQFINSINTIFKTEESGFRLLEGDIIRIDSEFIESEIRAYALKLLSDNKFEKANKDFQDARKRLSQGDFNGTIYEANNAIESLLKKILDKDKESQGNLKKALLQTGLVPDYFQGFVDHFGNLLQAAFTIANKSSRHGQKEIPEERNQVDEPVAAFLLNLVGSLMIFIIERYLDSKNE